MAIASIHAGTTKTSIFGGASGVFLITGIVSVLLSLWTNPAVFGQQLTWMSVHFAFLVIGFVGIFAGERLIRLERRIAELERKVGSGEDANH